MFGVIAIVFILMYLNEMYKNRRLEGKINELEDRRVRDIKDRLDREDRVMRELEELHKHYKKTYETSDLDYNEGFYCGRLVAAERSIIIIKKEFKMEG